METVWKRTGTFRKDLSGDWTSHSSTTVYHMLISTNQINEPYDVVGEHHLRGQLLNKTFTEAVREKNEKIEEPML